MERVAAIQSHSGDSDISGQVHDAAIWMSMDYRVWFGGAFGGSIVNRSDVQMVLQGNTDLYFNRSGLDDVPAGLVPELVFQYDPSSCAEAVL